ncbi:hypothetical protein L3Y34_016679 [Caenorhabditis briggsae]|uniref:Uncharacterized protein n=1 Tax=Caenorhabditis briggsae TaxID=6238 RepID=A0AAE9DZR3_CAEBR|nr:hypothetical protein L3Y34_016679 [Caenorhabditis briggsae]
MRWSAEEKSYRLANYKRSWRRRRRTHLDELEFDGEEEDKLIWMWMENREKNCVSQIVRRRVRKGKATGIRPIIIMIIITSTINFI